MNTTSSSAPAAGLCSDGTRWPRGAGSAKYAKLSCDDVFVVAWRQDADKQLAMCHDASSSVYVSAWCPLDATCAANGTLMLLPASCEGDVAVHESHGPAYTKDNAALGVVAGQPAEACVVSADVQPGDVVVFSSALWHCSPANLSKGSRRVLYAQYSLGPLLASHSGGHPLCMAVPCGAGIAAVGALPASAATASDGLRAYSVVAWPSDTQPASSDKQPSSECVQCACGTHGSLPDRAACSGHRKRRRSDGDDVGGVREVQDECKEGACG